MLSCTKDDAWIWVELVAVILSEPASENYYCYLVYKWRTLFQTVRAKNRQS